MKLNKFLIGLFFLTAILSAFQVGSEADDTPWVNAKRGAVWTSYDFSTGGGTYQIVNKAPHRDIASFRITNVVAPTRVSRNQSYTVSYTVENRSLEKSLTGINAGLKFFYGGSIVSPEYVGYTVIPQAGNPDLIGPNSSAVFRFTVKTNDTPKGHCIIDGDISGEVNSTLIRDRFYQVPNVSPTLYNSAAVNYAVWQESVALLDLSPIELKGANASKVSVGQTFVVSVNVANLGEGEIGGTKILNLQLPTGIFSAPVYSQTFTPDGRAVNFSVRALTAVDNQVITVNIKTSNSAPVSDFPTDLSYPVTTETAYKNKAVTATVSVIGPAAIEVVSTSINFSSVQAYSSGPKVLAVGVKNTGQATMRIKPKKENLSFLTAGIEQLDSYTISLPPEVDVVGGQKVTINYVIDVFGGGQGTCTVNVEVSAIDVNSGQAISDRTALDEVSTYNVIYSQYVVVESIELDPKLLAARKPLTAKVSLFNPQSGGGHVANVSPDIRDLVIQLNGAGPNLNNGVSFNVTLNTGKFTLEDQARKSLTYTISPLAAAKQGVYHVNVQNYRPSANSGGHSVADPDGLAVAVTFNYDCVSPSVVAASSNFNTQVIAPTDNFRLKIKFDEDMNTAKLPQFRVDMNDPIAILSGNYLDKRTYQSGKMRLNASNEGWVKVSYTKGAFDLVGNSAIPSADILKFFVDATPPHLGKVTINSGQALTVNSLVKLDLFVSDNYSLTSNIKMMLLGTSDVSINPGLVAVDSFVPFSKMVTLNLSTDTLGTKNIYFKFQDQAGNISKTVTAQIYLDTKVVKWILPDGEKVIGKDSPLVVRCPKQVENVKFSYIVNGVNNTLGTLTADDLSSTLSMTYLWNTLSSISTATTNLTLRVEAFSTPLGGTIPPVDLTDVTVDNLPPSIAITPLATDYVNGAVIITGNATDNHRVVRVEVKVNNAGYLLATGTANWNFNFTVPATDPEGKTYTIIARAYDHVGNVKQSSSYTVTKTNKAPTIRIVTPASGKYVKGVIPISGIADGLLPLSEVDLSLNNPLFPMVIKASGTNNWSTTISFTTNGRQVVYARVTTNTVPPLQAVTEAVYEVDTLPPTSRFINIADGDLVAGSLQIAGRSADHQSGVSRVEININNTGWLLATGTANWSYQWNVPDSVPGTEFSIKVRAYDNTYLTPNVEVPVDGVSAITVNFNESALPSVLVTSPATGSYVNYSTRISGSSNAKQVWLSFDSGINWLTANMLAGGDWTYDWLVPPADAHGTLYNLEFLAETAQGITGQPVPAYVVVYEKDSVGPQSIIVNPVQNSSLPKGIYPVVGQIATVGSPLASSKLYLDGNMVILPNLPEINSALNVKAYQYDLDVPNDNKWHTLALVASDQAGNRTTSDVVNIFAGSANRLTYPIPTGNTIDFSNSKPIYATSKNIVLFENIDIGKVRGVYVDYVSKPIIDSGGKLEVDISTVEADHTITILTVDGTDSTFSSQVVNYDVTPPTINAIFDGVVFYYPGAVISPKTKFQLNIQDNGGSGFGTTASNNYREVTTNSSLFTQGTILRSVGVSGTTNFKVVRNDFFDPYEEIFKFDSELEAGVSYDLKLRVVDNAGNISDVFVVSNLIVNEGASGTSGRIDKKLPITNYPNPWNPVASETVRFTFFLKDGAKRTRIYIYNEIGELVDKIDIEGPENSGTKAGYNEVLWNGLDINKNLINNGIYLYIIAVDSEDGTIDTVKGKMVVIQQ